MIKKAIGVVSWWCGAVNPTASAEFDVLWQRGVRGTGSAARYAVQPHVVRLVEPWSRALHQRHWTHAVRRLGPASHAQRSAQGQHAHTHAHTHTQHRYSVVVVH